VPKGEGKGWSRGKTAANDARIARNAAGHQGQTYVRRRSNATRPRAPVGWSPQMAYVVGLIATDGCLITGRRRIDFCSSDRQLAETYLGCLGRDPSQIRVERTAPGGTALPRRAAGRRAVPLAAQYRTDSEEKSDARGSRRSRGQSRARRPRAARRRWDDPEQHKRRRHDATTRWVVPVRMVPHPLRVREPRASDLAPSTSARGTFR